MQLQTSPAAVPDVSKLCPICGAKKSTPWLKAPDRFHGRKEMFSLLRCPGCSVVWLEHPPEPAKMAYHYGLEYHHLISSSGEAALDAKWRTPKERVLKMAQSGAVLDLGCSSGGFLQSLKDTGLKLHGIEISEHEAQRARTNSGAQVFVGEILDADFAPESFDVVTCFHVLEHVYNPREVLAKVRHWLKPGGIFYLLIPNIETIEISLFHSYWYGLELPRHLYHHSPASLRRLFELSNYQEVFLRQQADCYVEKSSRYIADEFYSRMGIRRIPLSSDQRRASIPWRIVRKAMRLGVLLPFRHLAAASGRGAGIEAAFRKADIS